MRSWPAFEHLAEIVPAGLGLDIDRHEMEAAEEALDHLRLELVADDVLLERLLASRRGIRRRSCGGATRR